MNCAVSISFSLFDTYLMFVLIVLTFILSSRFRSKDSQQVGRPAFGTDGKIQCHLCFVESSDHHNLLTHLNDINKEGKRETTFLWEDDSEASTSQAYLNSNKKEQDRLAKVSEESAKITEKTNEKGNTAQQHTRNPFVGKHRPQATFFDFVSSVAREQMTDDEL